MWREIGDWEAGKLRPNSFSNRIKSTRIQTLPLSKHKDIISPHRGSVNSLQLDLTEGRYLLSGASDASAAVFDVQRGTDYVGSGVITRNKCLFVVDKQHEHGHKFAVWYPVDTILFVTGSYDHHINVWDTNTTQVLMDFKMPGKVYRTAMSPLATSHMLIAAGTEDVQVRLCDITPCLATAVNVMLQYLFGTLRVPDVFLFWINLSLSLVWETSTHSETLCHN